ncbi:MAG: hypothetical protein ACK559_39755, partial [bacterium]
AVDIPEGVLHAIDPPVQQRNSRDGGGIHPAGESLIDRLAPALQPVERAVRPAHVAPRGHAVVGNGQTGKIERLHPFPHPGSRGFLRQTLFDTLEAGCQLRLPGCECRGGVIRQAEHAPVANRHRVVGKVVEIPRIVRIIDRPWQSRVDLDRLVVETLPRLQVDVAPVARCQPSLR